MFSGLLSEGRIADNAGLLIVVIIRLLYNFGHTVLGVVS
jgi:hypothetical protein